MSKLYALTESEVIWNPSYGSDTNACFLSPKSRVWFCDVLCGYLLRAPTIFSKSLHTGRQHTRALCFNRIWSELDNIWLIQTDSRVWIFVVSREHCRVLIMIDELGWWWEDSSTSKSSSIDPNNKKRTVEWMRAHCAVYIQDFHVSGLDTNLTIWADFCILRAIQSVSVCLGPVDVSDLVLGSPGEA